MGVAWAFVSGAGSVGLFLLALSFLGASALTAAGWWQFVAGPETRVVVLAALTGGHVASNVIGLLVVGQTWYPAGQHEQILGVRAPSAVGLLASVTLDGASLAAVVPALRERTRVGS